MDAYCIAAQNKTSKQNILVCRIEQKLAESELKELDSVMGKHAVLWKGKISSVI